MRLQIFTALTVVSAISASFAAEDAAVPSPAAHRPNILVILADDLGYGELGCQGNPQIPTPHIDSLAKNGVRFTSGYVSRAGVQPDAGRADDRPLQQRFGHEFNLGATGGGLVACQGEDHGRPPEGGRLRHRDVRQVAPGLSRRTTSPPKRGFDWFYGFLAACRSYRRSPGDLGKSLLRGTADNNRLHHRRCLPRRRRRSSKSTASSRGSSICRSTPSTPRRKAARRLVPQDAGKYADRFPNIADEQRRIFAGMLSAMDDAVGVRAGQAPRAASWKRTR